MAELSDDLDFGALTEPIDPALARSEAERHERELGVPARTSRASVGCALAVILVVGLFTTALFAGVAFVPGYGWWYVVAGVVLAVTLGLCVYLLRSVAQHERDDPPRRLRLDRFAAANGLEYLATAPAPKPEGFLFGQSGTDERRHLENVVRWPGAELEVGEYHFIEKGGMHSVDTAARWDYVVVRLGRTMPDVLLHAKANLALAGSIDMREPTRFRAAGGGRFDLWAWRRDTELARSVVDQRLVDVLAGHRVDLQLDGDRALLYTAGTIDRTDPATWRWLLEVARLLRERTGAASR